MPGHGKNPRSARQPLARRGMLPRLSIPTRKQNPTGFAQSRAEHVLKKPADQESCWGCPSSKLKPPGNCRLDRGGRPETTPEAKKVLDAVRRRQSLTSSIARRLRRLARMETKAISMKATRCSLVWSKIV